MSGEEDADVKRTCARREISSRADKRSRSRRGRDAVKRFGPMQSSLHRPPVDRGAGSRQEAQTPAVVPALDFNPARSQGDRARFRSFPGLPYSRRAGERKNFPHSIGHRAAFRFFLRSLCGRRIAFGETLRPPRGRRTGEQKKFSSSIGGRIDLRRVPRPPIRRPY